MTVFMPPATPVSDGRTVCAMIVAIAANAKPMPMPNTGWLATICQGSSCQIASIPAPMPVSAIPIDIGHLNPMCRPISPAAGPANSSTIELGSR